MEGETQSGMRCFEAEALLPEAIDGTLHGSTLAAFEAHRESCAACRTMVEEATAGMHWLKELDEAEPPRNLVHNILAQTIGALPSEHLAPKPQADGWLEKLKARLAPVFAPIATPRFAMSFGMAFFSITMLLSIAGFHFYDLRHLDLSSRGVTRAYYATEARVIRYYENIRLVYEIESRVRDLRRAATPDNSNQNNQQQQEAPTPKNSNPGPKNPSKTENRQQPQAPRYSRQDEQPELASVPEPYGASLTVPVVFEGRRFGRFVAAQSFSSSERAAAQAFEVGMYRVRVNGGTA